MHNDQVEIITQDVFDHFHSQDLIDKLHKESIKKRLKTNCDVKSILSNIMHNLSDIENSIFVSDENHNRSKVKNYIEQNFMELVRKSEQNLSNY